MMKKTCVNCKHGETATDVDPCANCMGGDDAYWEPIVIAKQDAAEKTCNSCKHRDKDSDAAPCAGCDCAAWGVRDAPETPSAWEPIAIAPCIQPPEHDNATETPTAPSLLYRAADIMEERGKQYDGIGGERSMDAAIAAFNAVTGGDLSVAEGHLLMMMVKLVRDCKRTKPHTDSCEDLIAYAALYGEARLGGE